MKYFSWLWNNSRGIRWNTVVRIIAGIIQVVLSLLMVWLSKRFIDETIRTGTADDVLRMVELLVLTVVGGVILRQVGYWLKTSANVRQSNALRLRIFGSLFHRQLFTGDELHSGDVSSRLAKDETFINAARNSNRETAQQQCAASMMTIIAQMISENTEFCRYYLDNPTFMNMVNQRIFDLVYKDITDKKDNNVNVTIENHYHGTIDQLTINE